jgi:hypothetical protein
MATPETIPATTSPPTDPHLLDLVVPPLRHGDRLTRAEFERRYEAMPHIKKAELIEGVVYMPSPVRAKQHGEPHGDLVALLWNYRHATPGIRGGVTSTVRMDLNNEPQPDGMLYIDPVCGGQAQIDDDGYVVGAPELAAEISASTVAVDLDKKRIVYRRNKVQEYMIWRVLQHALDWFILQGEEYVALTADADGISRSRILPGLWIDVAALLGGDFIRVHAVLQDGLQSPEHAEFVARLQAATKEFHEHQSNPPEQL